MTQKPILGALTVALLTAVSPLQAQSRSGRAAYHLGTRGMATCARYEPIGSILRVTNPQTGKTITVRVSGRGPYNGNRILDLSPKSFKALYGGLGRGVGPVKYQVIKRARR